MPTAADEIDFAITGPGKIIGVGNGDPSSHEADKLVDKVASPAVVWRMLGVSGVENRPEVAADFDDSAWQLAFGVRGGGRPSGSPPPRVAATIYRGAFELPETKDTTISLLLRDMGQQHWIYLNGQPVARNVARDPAGHQFDLDATGLRSGKNVIAIIATPLAGSPAGRGGQAAVGRGNPAAIRVVTPAGSWKRSLFGGLAEVIVQSTGQPGEITLTATAKGLAPAVLKMEAQAAAPRPAEPAR